VLAFLIAASGAACFPTPASALKTRPCSGAYSQNAPGAVLRADRLRAAGDTTCRYARYIVRSFLRKQARDINCAGAAANPGTVCIRFGRYECEKQGRRASCLDQGHGVTFRQRDRSTG
jgi:hypothetical protein